MKIISLTSIIFSSMMAISNCNLIMMWAFLEINSISFISFMKSSSDSDNMMKYFLVQTLGSVPLIMTITLPCFFFDPFLESFLLIISMTMKMGAAPFHLWMVQMVKNIKWKPFFILLSIQKVAPIAVLGLISKSTLMTMFVLFSSSIGAMSIFSSTKMELIIVFSSISHLSWIIMSEILSKKSSMIYLSMYSAMILLILTSLKKDKIKNINSQEKMEKSTPLLLSIFSLSGMPPTIGFFPKMMVIFLLIKSLKQTIVLACFLLFSAMISAAAYLRLMMKTMTMAKKKSKFKSKKNSLSLHKMQLIFFPIMIMIFPF